MLNTDVFTLRKGDVSDPYCVCKLKRQIISKTKVIDDNLNPIWNHGPVEFELQEEVPLEFEVYDKDALSADDLMGAASLTYQQCVEGFSGSLSLGKENNGLLFVKVMLREKWLTLSGTEEEVVAGDDAIRPEAEGEAQGAQELDAQATRRLHVSRASVLRAIGHCSRFICSGGRVGGASGEGNGAGGGAHHGGHP